MSATGAEPGKDYTVQALVKGIVVIECLAGGEIGEWKTIREVAEDAELPENTTFRILETLVKTGWAEKSVKGKGYRQNTGGLLKHLKYAEQYYRANPI